ncbi:MAG: serine/threonine-protein kinase [Pseudomonadota bacterium]
MEFSNATLGKYEIREPLGKGSMGTVYRAFDPFASREVAIKVANSDSSELRASGVNPRKLFFNEAKISGMLKHPNIVRVYDAGVEDESIWFIVMEYVRGRRTLQEHCRPEQLLSIEDVVRVGFKCAVALDYAHSKGVIHRDIKPRNVLVSDAGEIKVGDFGVALINRVDSTETQLRGYIGSPLYMSPEQIADDQLTNRSDIFSLGIVLYELLTGRNPFLADSLPGIIHNISNEAHVPLRVLRPEIPELLEHMLDRTLSKDPDQRYKNAIDFAGDLTLAFDQLSLPKEQLSNRAKYDRVSNLKFFQSFGETERWEVINASQWKDYSGGESIIVEGEVDNSFYVIVSGGVVIRKGGAVVDRLGSGDCFGEMAFIEGRKRATSIIASEHVSVLQVRASMIERASLGCQLTFHKVFLHSLIERLSDSAEQASIRAAAVQRLTQAPLERTG